MNLEQVLEIFGNNVNKYVFWKDRNSTYVWVNAKLIGLMGLNSLDEVIGKTDYNMPWKKEEADYFREMDKKVMDSRIPEIEFEEPQTLANGKTTWLQTSKIPLINKKNEVIGILGWYSDITDIKEMKINLDENSKQIIEHNQMLKQLNNQLELTNLDLEKFTYAASHDLKNPLRIIQTGLEIIELNIKDLLPKKHFEIFNEVKKSANLMQELISDILDYAKTGSADIILQKANLKKITEQKIFLLKNVIEEKDVKININLPEKIVCYPSLMGMVFYNLISNGIKFNASVQPIIDVDFKKLENKWQFTVKDNGIGIPVEFKDVIFETFNRLHNSDTYEGSGIGLSICKRVINIHKGTIVMKPNPKGGSIFIFEIIDFE